MSSLCIWQADAGSAASAVLSMPFTPDLHFLNILACGDCSGIHLTWNLLPTASGNSHVLWDPHSLIFPCSQRIQWLQEWNRTELNISVGRNPQLSSSPTARARQGWPKVKDIVQILLKQWQTWGTEHPFRKPDPVSHHSLGKETLTNVQSTNHTGLGNMLHFLLLQRQRTGKRKDKCPQKPFSEKQTWIFKLQLLLCHCLCWYLLLWSTTKFR